MDWTRSLAAGLVPLGPTTSPARHSGEMHLLQNLEGIQRLLPYTEEEETARGPPVV